VLWIRKWESTISAVLADRHCVREFGRTVMRPGSPVIRPNAVRRYTHPAAKETRPPDSIFVSGRFIS
jgi:hypothetical protein